MSSSSVPVFPLNQVSYVVDRSITNPGGHLEAFEHNINTVSVQQWAGGPTEVYIHRQVNINAGSNVQLYKIGLGPLEISISYDPDTTGIILQIFLTVPIVGTVSVGSVSGSLTEGVSVKVGFGSLLGGEVGARLRDGHGYLYYDFTAFGKHLQGEVKIF